MRITTFNLATFTSQQQRSKLAVYGIRRGARAAEMQMFHVLLGTLLFAIRINEARKKKGKYENIFYESNFWKSLIKDCLLTSSSLYLAVRNVNIFFSLWLCMIILSLKNVFSLVASLDAFVEYIKLPCGLCALDSSSVDSVIPRYNYWSYYTVWHLESIKYGPIQEMWYIVANIILKWILNCCCASLTFRHVGKFTPIPHPSAHSQNKYTCIYTF